MTTTGTILDKIIDTKHEEVEALLRRSKRAELIAQCADLPPTRGFREALTSVEERGPHPLPLPLARGGVPEATSTTASRPPVADSVTGTPRPFMGEGTGVRAPEAPCRLIAEVKKASPSKGVIREDFDPVAIAKAYYAGGASCLSILTDETYFQGSLEYLGAIREAVPLPLLRKDFIVDPAQIYEARIAGADAILLIVAAVPSPARLAELRHVAESLGLAALVEIHDAAELELAVESGAKIIGVNNRDLRDFTVRMETAETLIPTFPEGTIAVAESGIFTQEDVLRMGRVGANAVLVGEALMRQDDITAATQALLGTNA